jgi:FkbM family methyltransferase
MATQIHPPALIPVLRGLLGERAATALDVGARWGAGASWYALPPLIATVGFEPDPDECARLNQQRSSTFERYEPVALGKIDGKVQLTLTEEPGCSSIFAPDPEVIARYPLLRVMRPQRSIEVEVTRLETWAKRAGCGDVAFLKLDVQGAELDILEGAGDLLDGCVGLEVEVEFFPLYLGQPLFSDIEQFLRARGFSLWRLGNLVHYSEGPTLPRDREDAVVFNGDVASFRAGPGRLCWANALFFRDHRRLPPGAWRARLLLAAFLHAAREFDGMKGCLAGLVDDPETRDEHRAAIRGFLREWADFERAWIDQQRPASLPSRLFERLSALRSRKP